ncbi:unnamed protein product [Rhizophagus irregularis]|nr:unnamed protein product [Rhizophagus irregularis]
MDSEKIETQKSTIIEILSETKVNVFDNTKEYNDEIEIHKKSIDRIIISQYIDDTDNKEYDPILDAYVVTYSKDDNSILGWYVDIEGNGQQQPNVYFKLDRLKKSDYNEMSFILCKKILFLCSEYFDRNYCLIDLSSNLYLELNFYPFSIDDFKRNMDFPRTFGFLPNGDLIKASHDDCKIFKFFFKNKPKNTASWKPQIYDINVHEILNKQYYLLDCFVCQTKLFLFVGQSTKTVTLQFDLSTMTLDRQYNLDGTAFCSECNVINKNQTLWATKFADKIYIFSMESGMLISKYPDGNYTPVELEFITLENGSEGLIIEGNKFIDPYQPSDAIDITEIIDNKNVITKLNRKVYIDKNYNVCVAGGLDENKFQLNKTSIYTLPILKFIQEMLKDIINKGVTYKNIPGSEIDLKIENGDIFLRLRYKPNDNHRSFNRNYSYNILSFKLLNNQYLILIHVDGIEIYEITEDKLECRYYWYNEIIEKLSKGFKDVSENDRKIKFINDQYIKHIKNILENEFNISKSSIPCPIRLYEMDINKFVNDRLALSKHGLEIIKISFESEIYQHYRKKIVTSILDDSVAFSKFGSEILKVAIEKRYNDLVEKIINKIIKLIQNNSESNKIIKSIQNNSEGNNYITLLPIISSNIPELCKDYPDHLIKYISCTSFILSSTCYFIGTSENTSLHPYSNNYIKRSNMCNNYFKFIFSLFKELSQNLSIQEKSQTISFVVPFPQICLYQDDIKNNDHKIENAEDC